MRSIKTAIVEDEKKQQEITTAFLKKFEDESKVCHFQIDTYLSSLEFLEHYPDDVELLFLDIRMPGISGMDIAREIRQKDPLVMIVFITSLGQYAIDGYSVGAFDYMLKPLQYPEFKIKLFRIVNHVVSKETDYLMISTVDSVIKIPVNQIVYIETQLHNVLIHDNDLHVYKKHASMKEVEEQLSQEMFCRINSSYIVNLSYCASIEKEEMILIDGSSLKISRPRSRSVYNAFREYRK